jgi:tight adherence protein C
MSEHVILVLGLIAIFAGIAAAIVTVGASASDRQQVGRSLAALEAMGPRRDTVRRDLDRPFAERVLNPFVSRLSRLGNQFSPRDESARLRHRIELAGSPQRWDVERVVAFKVLGLVAGLAVGVAGPLLGGAGLGVTVGVAALLAPLVTTAQTSPSTKWPTTATNGFDVTCPTRWTC